MGGLLERSVLEPLSSQLNGMFTLTHENNGRDLMNAARTRLSKRQMEVLKLLGQGKTNKEIAMRALPFSQHHQAARFRDIGAPETQEPRSSSPSVLKAAAE
jgi:FixJ family two-component response regulator